MKPVRLVDTIKKPGFVWHAQSWKHGEDFHRHQKAQLIFVAEGYQYLHTPTNRFLLPSNHAAWIPSNWQHKTTASSEYVSLWTLYYKVDVADSFYKELHLFSTPPVLQEMLLYTKKWSLNRPYDQAEQAFLRAILLELPAFKKSGAPLQLPYPQDSELLPIVTYITQELSTLQYVKDLETIYPFSLRTLERKFKADLGMSIAQYIQLAKIIKSVELLSQGQYTIKEVARLMGYASSESFSNQFTKLMGQRPSTFMEK